MPTQILQVITDTDRRGAQVFACDLQRALMERGRAVRTVALTPGAADGLDVPQLGPSRRAPATMRALRKEILRAQIVVAHGSTTLPVCAISRAGTGRPLVYRQVSDSLFWAPTRHRRWRVRTALSRATKVVALWPGAADTMHVHFGVPRDRLVVIPNGVDPARFPPIDRRDSRAARLQLGLDPDRRTVACIGALVPEKGVDLAIESVGTMADVQLLVTGAGPERASLEALAGREAPRRVVFVEPLADPTPALTAADVVVLPSRGGDSMPAVLIEAAFAGVPIVATPIEGIPEIVVADATGLLVPVGSVSELRAAIGRILETPGLAARLSAAARARCIERFTMDRVAADWDRVLGATIEAATP